MINIANTAFVLSATILVFWMTPGLAFFYGGLVSPKNVVNTMLSVFIICGIAVLLFITCGYELCFGPNIAGIIGGVHHLLLHGVDSMRSASATHIPMVSYLLFQLMFALITPALFVGAVVGRMRFNYFLLFLCAWTFLVYYPLVHMVWTPHGLLARTGLLDFAGGTVVHINAGITSLVLSVILGRRLPASHQHYNLPWILLGTSILWIGWYGFNAGAALGITPVALQAILTTTVATAGAITTWMVLEIITRGHPTLVGTCTGTLCGLVGITPAAGYVSTTGALLIGVLCTCASFAFINWGKRVFPIDDPLDAFGCHGIAGICGSVLTGVFATRTVNPHIPTNGLLYGGGWHLLGIQAFGTITTILFVTIMAGGLALLLARFVPMRVSKQAEQRGLDQSEHGEQVDYTVRSEYDVRRYQDEFRGQLGQLYHHKKF